MMFQSLLHSPSFKMRGDMTSSSHLNRSTHAHPLHVERILVHGFMVELREVSIVPGPGAQNTPICGCSLLGK